MRITGLNTVELEQYPGALAPKYSEAVLETDADNAAYRGLSNGAQEVEIGMVEIVSENPTYRSLVMRAADPRVARDTPTWPSLPNFDYVIFRDPITQQPSVADI